MADEQTQVEWEKSKRIEAERMKAARALADETPDKSNLAFLDPKATKVKGWSADSDVILADGEKVGNRSLIFAIAGIVLSVIGSMGSIVSTTFNLGLAGVILDIPRWIGVVLMAIAVLMAIVSIVCEVYFKAKRKRKFSIAFWTSLCVVILVVLYFVVQWVVL